MRQSGSITTRRARPVLLATTTVVALLAAAPVAHGAATVSRSGDTFTLTGDAAADVISMRPESGQDAFVRFVAEPASSLTPGTGCRRVTSRILRRETITCGRVQTRNQERSMTLRASLGGGNDVFKALGTDDRSPRFVVDAGDGDDEVIGTVLADEISGGPGNDELHGQSDIDVLRGDAGNDTILGDGDADIVAGGPGQDRLYGDGADGPTSPERSAAGGGNVIDATDVPSTLVGLTAEQILAIAPEPDLVACGPGTADSVVAEAVDTVSPTCEIRLAPGTVRPPVSPVVPFTQTLTANPDQRLSELLRGQPFRFTVTPSVGSLVSAKLTISPADARRLGLGRGESARTLAVARPVLIAATTPGPLLLRIRWGARDALRDARNLRVTVTISSNHANDAGTAPVDSVASSTVTLGR